MLSLVERVQPLMRRAFHYLRTVSAFAFFSVGGGVMSWVILPTVWSVAWLLSRDRESATRHCQSSLQIGFRLFLWLLARLRLLETQWPLSQGRAVAEPSVIICNHPCLLDTVTMVARYDHVVCLVKQSYYDNPFFLGLCKLCGFIPAGREGSVRGHQRMIDEAVDRIRRGYTILAFPESRRTPLREPLPFRRGPFEIAARAGVPVIPVRLTCTPRILFREMPIHEMPLVCASYSAVELPAQHVAPGRAATKAAMLAVQDLLLLKSQAPCRTTEDSRSIALTSPHA